jgi:hypothetical protein
MNGFIDASVEYYECLNHINTSTIQTLNWNRVKTLVFNLYSNPMNFTHFNNIYVSLANMVVSDVTSNGMSIMCPYEVARFYIYQVGIPFYYDNVRISSLLFSLVLKNQFCLCNHSNCQFKPPVPDVNYLPLLQTMIPK